MVLEVAQYKVAKSYAAPGQQVVDINPGDIILTHGDSFVNKFVYGGQRLRMFLSGGLSAKDRHDFAYYDHVSIYVGYVPTFEHPEGEPCVIEALPGKWRDPRLAPNDPEGRKRGVRLTPLSAYNGREYHVAHTNLSPADADQAVDFAFYQLGRGYGLVGHYVGMTITTLSGGTRTYSGANQEICSSLVAACLTRGQYIWDRAPASMMPADLARHFNVRPPRVERPKER